MARADIIETRGELEPKEFRVEVRLRNNRLIRYREQLGLKPREMAERIGVSYGILLRYEGLRQNPLGANGDWKDTTLAIANYHGVSPSFFWPASVLAIEKTMATVELSSDEARRLIAPGQTMARLAPAPDEGVVQKQMEETFRLVLSTLTPREERLIVYRFGLRGEEEHTLGEIAERFGVGKERIRQIEAKALRKLRHPARSRRVKPFIDKSLSPQHPRARAAPEPLAPDEPDEPVELPEPPPEPPREPPPELPRDDPTRLFVWRAWDRGERELKRLLPPHVYARLQAGGLTELHDFVPTTKEDLLGLGLTRVEMLLVVSCVDALGVYLPNWGDYFR